MTDHPEYCHIEFEMHNPQNESYSAIAKDLERFIGETGSSLFPLISFIVALKKKAQEGCDLG